jgi:hypothetical protein
MQAKLTCVVWCCQKKKTCMVFDKLLYVVSACALWVKYKVLSLWLLRNNIIILASLTAFWTRAIRSARNQALSFSLVIQFYGDLLGNSGKPVTLETSSFTKFVKWVFRNFEPAKIWNLEPAKLRSRELAKIWNLEPAKLGSREPVKIWSLGPAKLGSHEPVKIWSLGPTKLMRSRTCEDPESWIGETMKSGVCGIRESAEVRVWKSWRMKISWMGRLANLQEAKSKTLPQKVRVWRVN